MYEAANESLKFCPNCGGAVVDGSRFCRLCGCDLLSSDVGASANPLQPEIGELKPATPDYHAMRSSRKPALIVAVSLLVVGLIGVAIFLSILYVRHRRQSSQSLIAASQPDSMGQKAMQIEVRILRDDALSNADLGGLSAYELRVLRNVHFARHGRKYDRPGLGDYFVTREWYKPDDNYNDTMLTAVDKSNVRLIVEMERQVNSQTTASTANSTPSPYATPNIQTNDNSVEPDTEPGKLTNSKVQRAIQRWMSGGSVVVQGIQEVPQQNAAVAQMTFTNLNYKLHDPILGGNNPRTYSGPGNAIFAHYNDGRWVLTKITIGRGFDSVWWDNLNIEAR